MTERQYIIFLFVSLPFIIYWIVFGIRTIIKRGYFEPDIFFPLTFCYSLAIALVWIGMGLVELANFFCDKYNIQ